MSNRDNEFTILRGRKEVLISCPHSFSHLRPGYCAENPKPPELGLIQIAKNLCRDTDCWGIIATSFQSKNPNWCDNSPYRKMLARIVKDRTIRLVFDLHESKTRNYPLSLRYNRFASENLIETINFRGLLALGIF